MSSLHRYTMFLAIAGCASARTPDAYRADTEKAFATKSDEIKSCYDKVLAASPSAGGRVTVKFAVEEKTGKIVNPTVDNSQTTAPEAVSQCVLSAIPAVAITPGDRKRGDATWTWEFTALSGPAK